MCATDLKFVTKERLKISVPMKSKNAYKKSQKLQIKVKRSNGKIVSLKFILFKRLNNKKYKGR